MSTTPSFPTAPALAPVSPPKADLRFAFNWMLVLLGAYLAARHAFPVEDVGRRCPPAADEGYTSCIVQKAYMPSVVIVVLGMCAGHLAATLMTSTIPRTVARATGRSTAPRRRRGDGARVADVKVPRAPRFAVELSVLLQRDGEAEPHRTSVVNASATGLLLRGDRVLRVGDGVTVTVEIGTKPIAARGRVVRKTRVGEYGVALEGLDPIQRGRLAGHLAKAGVAAH